MPIHPALQRRAEEARTTVPTRVRMPRVGHYSTEPAHLRRQVQELERRVAEGQDELARKVESE